MLCFIGAWHLFLDIFDATAITDEDIAGVVVAQSDAII